VRVCIHVRVHICAYKIQHLTVIFTQEAKYIPFNYLDIKDADGEVQIEASIFTPELVARSLGIPQWRLPELAVLCGNDIMAAYMDKYKIPAALGIDIAPFLDVPDWQRCHPQVSGCVCVCL
jgi:hypothetical protein